MSALVVRALRRLAAATVTLLGVTLVTFVLVHLAPGDAAELRAGAARGATAATVEANRRLAGLDRPLGARYLAWLERSARLDFGRSLVDGAPVRERLGGALPTTLALGGVTLALALPLAFAFAIGLSRRRDGALRAANGQPSLARVLDGALALLQAVPAVAVALWLLEAGAAYGSPSVAGLLAPALCLALPLGIALARHQAAGLDEALALEWVRAARARGLSDGRLLLHALRATLAVPIALLAAEVPALLSGAVLVETVFGLRGLGALGYEALLGRDEPTLLALVTVGAALALAASLGGEVATWLVDPRLRDAATEERAVDGMATAIVEAADRMDASSAREGRA